MKHLVTVLALLSLAAVLHAQTLHPIWDRSGTRDSVRFGMFITALGNQNNGGYKDWAVSAPAIWYANAGQSYVEFFHGGNPPSSTPYYRIGTEDSVYSINGVFPAGDLNGDSYPDWYVDVWPTRNGPGLIDYFYLGGPNHDMHPDYAQHHGYQEMFLPVGDFNGDGFGDLYLKSFDSGVGQMFYGGNPMDFSPDWSIHDDPPGSYSSLPWGFGDMNGDGYADVVAGPDSEVWIYFGGANPDTVPDIQIPIVGASPHIRVVKDLNGDGADELVVALDGVINVFLGGRQMSSTPDYVLNTHGGSEPFTLVTAGDFNHDRHNDLLVVDPDYPGASGMFALYLGSRWLSSRPAVEVTGRGQFNLVGIMEAEALGDVNGDGVDDFAIGATNLDNDGKRGRAVIFAGDTSYYVDADPQRPELPQDLQVAAYPNPFNASTTIKLSVPTSAHQVELRIFQCSGARSIQ